MLNLCCNVAFSLSLAIAICTRIYMYGIRVAEVQIKSAIEGQEGLIVRSPFSDFTPCILKPLNRSPWLAFTLALHPYTTPQNSNNSPLSIRPISNDMSHHHLTLTPSFVSCPLS